MKHMKDMNDAELAKLYALTQHVSEAIEQCPRELPQRERPALMCLFVKFFDRPTTNLKLEYETDPDLFIDDAIQQTIRYIENTQYGIRQMKKKEIEGISTEELIHRSQYAIDFLFKKEYRPLVVAVMKKAIGLL